MPKPTTISGFTIVRNAEVLGYPFRESVLSVISICDEFVINCGDSTDSTRKICTELQEAYPDKIRIIDTIWTTGNQSGGYQLKAQTDRAISECTGTWCLYVQADEAIHEDDLAKIRNAITRASLNGKVDGILFDYIHFYGNFTYAIRGRNWYRREVRCFKNYRGITSFRDAQGFRKDGARLKVIESGARVFHYGYVRSSEGLKTKSKEMSRWWGTKPQEDAKHFQLINHIGLYRFPSTHPAVMQSRIKHNSEYFNPKDCPRKWDKREIKNALTLFWEAIFKVRLGEFRNYECL